MKGRAFDVASQGAFATASATALGGSTTRPLTTGTTASRASTLSSGGGGGTNKVDADELLLTWMSEWGEWVDEVLRPGFDPMSPRAEGP